MTKINTDLSQLLQKQEPEGLLRPFSEAILQLTMDRATLLCCRHPTTTVNNLE